MDNNLNHNEWRDEAPYLADLPKVNPFTIPAQYFEGLSDRITAAVYVDDLKINAGIFEADVPEGYFENLTENINARITLEALALPKEDGFEVPEGYFNTLQGHILEKIAQENEPAKVVKLWPARVAKYAAAASIVLVSAFAIYFNQDKLFNTPDQVAKTSVVVSEDNSLWEIDEQTIRDQMDTEITEQVTNTSATSSELEDYIISHYTQNEIVNNL